MMHGLPNLPRTLLVVAVVTAAAASGCGGDDDGVALVGTAAAATAQLDSYEVTAYQGTQMVIPALGVDIDNDLSRERPFAESLVDGENSHIEIDLAAMLGLAGQPGAPTGDLAIWQTPDRLVIDTLGFAEIVEANPAAELGPLSPAVSVVALDDPSSGEDLAAALGSDPVDFAEMAERLPAALGDVSSSTDDDGTTITGTATYAAVLEAQGSSVDTVARSAAAGIALNLAVDTEALADVYGDFYRSTPADVRVRIENDVIVEFAMTAELGGIFQRIADDDELGLEAADDEFDGTEWTLETLTVIAPGEVEIPTPPADPTDRTAEWLTFAESAGLMSG